MTTIAALHGCGKTTALALLEKLTLNPERFDNATPAVIYHLIDRLHGGTMLVDEADNLGLNVNGILRAILNSGHRKGGSIRRVIKGAPKKFSTFAPMSVAAIGSLPLPLLQRSIVVHMEKTTGGGIKRFETGDRATMQRVNIVYGFVTRWARAKPQLDLDPDLPKDLRNRTADNWRTLISIADCFGDTWAYLAREAAVTFAHAFHDEDAGVILLADLRTIFNRTAADRMASVDLITALLEIEESGWSEYRGAQDDQTPRKLSQGEMARLLKPFGMPAAPDLAAGEAARKRDQQARLLSFSVRERVGALLRGRRHTVTRQQYRLHRKLLKPLRCDAVTVCKGPNETRKHDRIIRGLVDLLGHERADEIARRFADWLGPDERLRVSLLDRYGGDYLDQCAERRLEGARQAVQHLIERSRAT